MANEYIRKEFAGGAVPTTLNGDITNVATSIVVASGSTLPTGTSPFVVSIDRGAATEEKVLCSARTGNTLTALVRGYDGTTAQAHTSGAAVVHVLDAWTIDQVNALVNAMTTAQDMVRRGASAGQYVRVPESEWRVPAGTIAATIAASAPAGYLFHNQAIAACNTTYPALWAIAPASWKSGTTLNIPDLTDACMMQAGTTTLGATGGANSRSIGTGNLPAHTHAIDHAHGAFTSGNQSANHQHGFSGTTSGQSNTHNHSPAVANEFISQVVGGGSNFYTGGGASYASSTVTGANNQDHTHTYSGTTAGVSVDHTHTTTISAFTGTSGNGGFAGTALTTTPKHVAVNIMIKAH